MNEIEVGKRNEMNLSYLKKLWMSLCKEQLKSKQSKSKSLL